jgi:predicted dehydrogenase/threonine dehydrogenase-like Zn-dependent dehydrogenase
MKQIIQDLKNGDTLLIDVPAPQVRRGCVLIKTHRSLVSLGTERMLVEFGRANFLDKARQQPDKVKQVLDKIKSDGLWTTVDSVMKKLDEPLPLGYCNAGEVIAVGEGVSEFKIGDRVVSNGNHAEFVCIPQNLVAQIPEGLSYDEAAFTVIGSIALQGIRLVNPTFGEKIVVVGLGLIGLITCQLLIANGCEVIGFDFDDRKVDLAKNWGVKAYNVGSGTDPVKTAESLTNGVGVDGVIITASTKSNDVIAQAATMSRKRGRIVLVGVIGLDLKRSDFFEKELTFQVSCSYGPGRYDEAYEQKGIDYPLPFVRWTEKRNFEAILFALATEKLKVKELITEVVKLEDYNSVYGEITDSSKVASLLAYDTENNKHTTHVQVGSNKYESGSDVIGIIGAGNFTKMVIVPTLSKLKANIKAISSASGVSSTFLAKKYNIGVSSTNYKDLLNDAGIKAIMITTRHNLHASMTIEALNAGKHVFVEKPLALTKEEATEVEVACRQSGKTVLVGFNRRFSPFATEAKKMIGNSDQPMNVIATMNAGNIPASVWVHDMKVGGGRILGEACHYVDLISYLTGSKVESVLMSAMGTNPADETDNAVIILKYENGSQGVINYFANGHKSYSKERIEVYSQGRTLIVDNFRKLSAYGFKSGGFSKSQDKGHTEQFRLFIESLKQGGKELIPFDSVMNTTFATLATLESLKTGNWVKVNS